MSKINSVEDIDFITRLRMKFLELSRMLMELANTLGKK